MSLRKKIFSCLLVVVPVIFLPTNVTAQSASEMKEIFAKAESYFLYGEYELANQLYILLDSTNNRNIQYKIGVCYLNIPGEKEKSVPYLEKAILNASYDAKETRYKEKRAPLDAYFYLGKAYMINNELDKGMTTLQTFYRLATQSKGKMENMEFLTQQLQAVKNAMSFTENPVHFSKRALGEKFSQGALNENPAVSYDGNTIVYTERRGTVNAIYFSQKIRGVWQEPIDITEELKAGEDASSCSLNRDGTELYLYKTDDFDGAIYVSKFDGERWSPITRLNRNINTKFYESHACISADGKKLYFTSNRDGSLGGLDIYVSERTDGGDWGEAKNLGPVVNTPFNEDTPFVTENDSLIFFSSEGHNSMGGYDLYKSVKMSTGWSVPSNLGYPINSTDDDRFLQPSQNGNNAFYSITTNYKQKDLFHLNFGDIYFDIRGVMRLSDTTLIFDENFFITVSDKTTGDTLGKVFPDPYNGSYSYRVKPGAYTVNFKGAGYFQHSVDTVITTEFPLAEVFIDATLNRDPSASKPASKIVYEKIDLSVIPKVEKIDSSILVKNTNLADEATGGTEEILYYTVQVIALRNPVDVSYFKYIDNLKVHFSEKDKFYRYTSGEFKSREDANKWRLDLISRGYPKQIFIKVVTRNQNP